MRGKIIGIVGYGHIGSQLSVMSEAMGMRVLFYDIVPKLPLGNSRQVDSLDALLKYASSITHIPFLCVFSLTLSHVHTENQTS